ncbi:hypothetical protein PC123_g6689 [Phytophthora cactorum]|nr:hypothetical protein PC120_g9775 [Phytophthora cactorum]KAG4058325.1 hypothetical protein PC123_g6689 [Phytophthora cactorum]
MTPEEEVLARQRNTCSRRELRNALALEEQEREHSLQERERVAQEEEAREAQREAVRIRRKCMQRGHSLCNHERFAIARVSGKNVRDGHHALPEMYECIWCGAWKWPGESDVSCCFKGRVQLPPLTPAPSYLLGYYRDEAFRRNIRAYNQVFAFTSVGVARSDGVGVQGVREDRDVQGQQGVYSFRIQDFQPAKFAQIYIVDEDHKQRAERRKSIFADLDREKLTTLEMMMQTYNPFAQQFLSYAEKIRQDREAGRPVMDLKFQLHADKRRPGTTNLPTTNEVGAVMIEDGISKYRDLILYTQRNGLLRIFETNPMYDPLQYPLLFPGGDLGWTYTDKYANGNRYRQKDTMSLREHVAYRLFPKPGDGSALHLGGRVFQQYCVDQRAKVEQEALRWVSNNQATLRADLYSGIQDAYLTETPEALDEGEGRFTEYTRSSQSDQPTDSGQPRRQHFLHRIGKCVILPSSYTGGPRQMYRSYQDSMAIVREYGKPDIFLTMTCNPEWDEIVGQIPPGLSAQDRPDIVARVWQQNLKALLTDLNEGVLGRVLARIYVVEFKSAASLTRISSLFLPTKINRAPERLLIN